MAKSVNNFLTDIRISTLSGPRMTKVIVLNETDKAIVYIPLNAIARVDYERFKAIHEKAEVDLLTALRDEKLDNGRNALVTYKDIIGVYQKEQPKEEVKEPVQEQAPTQSSEEPAPRPRRKPGPKPKPKAEKA